jgi:hypothetical protein
VVRVGVLRGFEEEIMIAYHGDPSIKEKYLARVRAHRAADNLVRGVGWKDGKGCAIGCTLESYDHERYPIELGIPVKLARLEDAIFEGLPDDEAMEWPERFLSAIRPGADLSMVWPRFAVELLIDPEHGAAAHVEQDSRVIGTIGSVVDLYKRQIAGDDPPVAEWTAARARADDMWSDAVWAAAGTDAVWAAMATAKAVAARAASAAAESAAWASARAAMTAVVRSRPAAREAAYKWQADTLIRLLEEAR